ncbi:MAG: phosphoribosylanthranilate isomerase [Leptospiraceae bacterium]|nr:phosphoribosylanthranilate isomerase [Leptospiraceae bacterium]
MPVVVKICGIKSVELALSALEYGADMIGLNFSPESKRRVDLKIASSIFNELNKNKSNPLQVVGLFYKNTESEIKKIISEIPFDFLQFVTHDEFLNWEMVSSLHKNVIPQISVKEFITDEDLKIYDTEFVILDSYKQGLGGGSGNSFEWENAKQVSRKYLLAGGLNPSNVQKAISVLQPFGVDVASGVESSPGVKDKNLIKEFIQNAKRI